MLMQIHNFLRGSLQVDIQGAAIERFLNLCAIHGVAFWDIQTLDADHFTAWVSAGGYFALRPYARKTGCRVRVSRKKGLPFAVRSMTRRWALWLSVLLCAAVVFCLSGFVWTIEVQGCRQITQREMLQLLQQAGLRTGTRRSTLNIRELRNAVMLQTDKLSYFTVNFKGTQAVVRVWEKRNRETKPEVPGPCDVVSDLTGIVLELRVRTGQALVKVGDTLQAGDRIATGVIVNQNDETEQTLLHAEAEADVRTWYTLKTVVPAELQTLSYAEPREKSLSLLLGQRRFPLKIIEKPALSCYDKKIDIHVLQLQDNFRWPIALVEEQTTRCAVDPGEVDRETLAEVLEQRMTTRLRETAPEAELVRSSFRLEKTSGGAWLGVLEAELVETTGKEVPIG